MGEIDFDSWREPDLLLFLRTLAELADRDGTATGADVQQVLHIPRQAAIEATRRLETLRCIEEPPRAPRRGGDGILHFTRRLTAVGTTAVIDRRLPKFS